MRTSNRTRMRVAAAAALALALVASGCSDDGGESDDGGTVELSFMWWGGDSRHEYTQELIDMFEAEHANISIEPIFTDFDPY